MEAKWKGLGLTTVVGIAFVLTLSGLASASGSGYNLSFTQSAGHSTNSAVDLIAVSSSYTSGANLTVTIQVSGAIDYTNSDYAYIVWFGGSSAENATSFASFTNGTAGYIAEASGGGGFGLLVPTITGGTLTFSIATAVVGSSSDFTLNAWAAYILSGNTGTLTWLGSNYQGGATCTSANDCTTNGAGTSSYNYWIIIIPIVVVVVIVVIVLVLVMRKKPPTQPGMMGQPGQPMGQPPGGPAPPADPTNWQTPPPPPPAGAQ